MMNATETKRLVELLKTDWTFRIDELSFRDLRRFAERFGVETAGLRRLDLQNQLSEIELVRGEAFGPADSH